MPEFKQNAKKALWGMLAHTAAHSPYYREQSWARSARRGASIALNNLPVTPKAVVRERTEQFYASEVPPSEGPVKTQLTSGSTGEPMVVRCAARFYQINHLEASRLGKGWGFEHHLNAVRIANPEGSHPRGTIEDKRQDARALRVFYTGDVAEAFNFVVKTGPSMLVTRPQMVLGILQHGADIGVQLPLKLISTITEVVPEQLRNMVSALPGCRLVDKYGTVETGVIAHQCSSCGAYHPADHQSVVEILDDKDRPTKPGKMGRVIVTPLFNAAMPLVRYDTGDYALVAKAHSCSHSPVSLERIVGRERNLFKRPDGRKIMPWVDPDMARNLGLRQFKLVQRSLTDLDLLYVPADPEAELAGAQAQELVDKCMAPGFTINCRKVSELPLAASGKYMMHESLV